MGGGGSKVQGTERKIGRTQILWGQWQGDASRMGRMGRTTETRGLQIHWQRKKKKKNQWGRQRILPVQEWGQTDRQSSSKAGRHIWGRRGRAWTRQRWTLSPKWVETALNRPAQRRRDLRLLPRLRVRVGWTPQLRNPATAVAAPASPAEPVTSGTLPAPPTRAGATPLADPGAPAGRRLPGPRVRTGDPRGTLSEPEAPAARLRVGGRPPSLSGRRAASLGGGEEGAVALASASRSSPAHVPALCARAREAQPRSSFPPASGSAAGVPVAATSAPSHPPPAPNSQQPQQAAASTAVTRPPTRKLFRRQPRGCQECEPGSGFLAPVAAGWKARAFEDLEPFRFGRVWGVFGAEVRGEGRTIKSPWARGYPNPDTWALEARGGERDRTRRAASGGE